MIFSALAKFVKSHLAGSKPIDSLLAVWMRAKIMESPSSDNVSRIFKAEFKLQELDAEKKFFLIPRSQRAEKLMKLLKDYIALMESVRLERQAHKIAGHKNVNDKNK